MVALLLFRLFGLRLTFLVSSAGLVAVDLAYLLLYHVYLKRGENWNEASGEKQEQEEEEEAVPEFH